MEQVLPKNSKNSQESKYRTSFILTIAVIIVNYYEIYNHFWFLKLLGGYVIKIWLLPALLFFYILIRQFIKGKIIFPSKNIRHLNHFLLFYVIFGIGALFVHETLWNIIKYSLMMFAPLMLYVVILYHFKDNIAIERMLKILFAIGLMFAIYSAYLYLIEDPSAWTGQKIEKKFMFSEDTAEFETYALEYLYLDRRPAVRHTIPGIDEPKFGGILCPLVLVGFYFSLRSKGYMRIFYYVSSFFLFYTVMSTLSRSSGTALLIGTLLFFMLLRKKILTLIFALLSIVLVLSVALYTEGAIDRFLSLVYNIPILGENQFIYDLVSKRGIYVQRDGHVESYSEGLKVVSEAPLYGLFGIGVKNFEDRYVDYRYVVPHNRYMFILNTTGILTLIPYAGFIILLIFISRKLVIRRLKSQGVMNNIGLVLYPATVALAIKLNNEGLEAYYYWIFFGLTVAWIRNLSQKVENENLVN